MHHVPTEGSFFVDILLHFEPPLNSLRIESGIEVFTIDDDKGIELKANRRIILKRADYTAPTPT